MSPENEVHIKLRLFDTSVQVFKEFGKYENLMLADLNVKQLMTDLRKTFNKTLNEFEISLTNQKEGKV